MIKPITRQIASDENTPVPKLRFREYKVGPNQIYYNNDEFIDFVTDGKSLYVCASNEPVIPIYSNIEQQDGFIKLVSQGEPGEPGEQGEDGAPGSTTHYRFRFDGGRLSIFENGTRLTTSSDLSGPA